MFTCDDCGKQFEDFRKGGYVQNLKTHCPECVGVKTFTVNVNGMVKHTTFKNAMSALKGLR